jgi:hypothetical protein
MEKNCLYCEAHFTTQRNNKKYCSDNCKQMAYFKRNGLVLSKAPELGGVKHYAPSATKEQNVKYVSEKPAVKDESSKTVKETVKYVSPLKVKDVGQGSGNSVKSDSEASRTNEAIELVLNQFMEKIEERMTKRLENVKQEFAVKYGRQTVKPNFTDEGSQKQVCRPAAFDGLTRAFSENSTRATTNKAPVSETVKYVLETGSVKDDRENQKADFTFDNIVDQTEIETEEMESEGEKQVKQATENNPPLSLFEIRSGSEEKPGESKEGQEIVEEEELFTVEKPELETVQKPEAVRIQKSEAEKLFPDMQLKHEAKNTVPSLKNDPEPEYKWVDPKIFKLIESYHQYESKESMFRDAYLHWNHQSLESINWINVRLRCLIESMLRLSNYSQIDIKTLFCIADAFNRLMKSDSYITLPSNYPYKELIEELSVKLCELARSNADLETVKFVLPLKRKTMLIALRHEMVKHTPSMKFSEMDFPEAINAYPIKTGKSEDDDPDDDEDDDDNEEDEEKERNEKSQKRDWKKNFEAFKRRKRREGAAKK